MDQYPEFGIDWPGGHDPEATRLAAPVVGQRPFEDRRPNAIRFLGLLLPLAEHRDRPKLLRFVSLDLHELDGLSRAVAPDKGDVVLRLALHLGEPRVLHHLDAEAGGHVVLQSESLAGLDPAGFDRRKVMDRALNRAVVHTFLPADICQRWDAKRRTSNLTPIHAGVNPPAG
jgi:hypothetical protein